MSLATYPHRRRYLTVDWTSAPSWKSLAEKVTPQVTFLAR
jgi:hypothetical protein